MKKLIVITLVLAVSNLLAVQYATATPNLISYQGVLNDDAGSPVSGNIAFVFSIYDVPSGSTALWTENQSIDVTNGVFDVQLGADTPVPSHLFNKSALYLGIKASTDVEMTPRQRITSSAYSQRVGAQVPVGSFIPWHKSATGTPVLEAGWVEANGQVLSDPESPYNGQVIPDLNGVSGQKRFLRGAAISGSTGGSDQGHNHQWYNNIFQIGGGQSISVGSNGGNVGAASFNESGSSTGWSLQGSLINTDYWTTVTDATPSYFEVVWIIRVK